jgi:quaternary ammonium compound-resistance protein SugE
MLISEVTKAWLLLLLAGVLEACWAIGLKYTNGFSAWLPGLLVVTGIAASVLFLSLAMRVLPTSTAYAVWTGIGVLGVALLGVGVLGERLTTTRAVFLALLVVAIVGLRLTAGGVAPPPLLTNTSE